MIEATDPLYCWPLLVTFEDVYVPEIADLIVATIREQSSEVCALTITIAIDAACWATGRGNRRTKRWQ